MSVAPPRPVILQGYLHKQSKHLKIWKVRYFILTENELMYSIKSGKKPKGVITLAGVHVIDDQNAVIHPGNHVLELRSPTRSIHLSTATEQERTRWVMALRSAQRDGSPHSTAASFAHAHSQSSVAILQRSASDTILNDLPDVRRRSALPTFNSNHRRRRKPPVSKERREERRRRHLPKMKKSFSEIWLEDVLPLSEGSSQVRNLEALCFAGIPKELRGRAWSWVLGNRLQINEDLFSICKTRAGAVQREMSLKKEADDAGIKRTMLSETLTSVSSESASPVVSIAAPNCERSSRETVTVVTPVGTLDEEQVMENAVGIEQHLDEEPELLPPHANILFDAVDVADQLVAHGERSIRLVGVDMPRTFGHHPLFQSGAEGTMRTTEVLEAYICYRPDLGYVQGMSYLAATLCFHMDSFTAFKAMVALLSNSVLFDMFRMEATRTFHYIRVHERILEYELPRLHAHFTNIGIEAQMYAVDWALTLFTRSLPLNLALRIWDCFVLLGSPFFFQASMGILSLYEERMLAMEPEDVMRFLHHLPKTTSSTELFEAIASVSLSCRDITAILAGGADRAWTPDSKRVIDIQYPETYE